MMGKEDGGRMSAGHGPSPGQVAGSVERPMDRFETTDDAEDAFDFELEEEVTKGETCGLPSLVSILGKISL
jgi:hypothetical protein